MANLVFWVFGGGGEENRACFEESPIYDLSTWRYIDLEKSLIPGWSIHCNIYAEKSIH